VLAKDTSKQILIIDRDVASVEPLRQQLTEAGFVVQAITAAAAALAAIAGRPPHLVMIDGDTAGFAALDLIQRVRRLRVPRAVRLIILAASSVEQDVVTWLELGADDYIAKPFSLREAVARVSALLRSHATEEQPSALSCDELVLEASSNRVMAHGRLVDLHGVEYRLLEFLMSHPGTAFNRCELLARVWGANEVDERTVDVNVQRLRKILRQLGCEAYLQTVRGFGYRLASPSAN
jgi:two-component system, OmpR family, phosphate regulon response regulator PhoB